MSTTPVSPDRTLTDIPPADPGSRGLTEDVLLLDHATHFEARGQISGRVLVAHAEADRALQAAVDFIAVGGPGTVYLSRGNFPLRQPVVLPSHVTLAGTGRGTRLVVTDDNPQGIGLLVEGADRVVVRDLLVVSQTPGHGVAGVVVDRAGQPRLTHVEAVGFGRYGIWVRNECFLPVVENCTAADNGVANFIVDTHHRGPRGNFPPITIINCTAVAGGVGFEIHKSTVVNVIACTVYQSSGSGFHIHNWSCSVLLSGCRTFQVAGHALVAEVSHELNLTGNVFCWHEKDGLIIRDCAWGVITGNEVIDSGSINPGGPDETFLISDLPPGTPVGCAISLHHVRGFAITGNTLFNWPQGRKLDNAVVEDDACHENSIAGNVINYVGDEAIVTPAGRSTINGNVVQGPVPFQGPADRKWIQTYQPEFTRRFIDRSLHLRDPDEPAP